MASASVSRETILLSLKAELIEYQSKISFVNMVFSIGSASGRDGYWRAERFLKVLKEVLAGDVNTPEVLVKIFTAAQREPWGDKSRPIVMKALMYLLGIGFEFTNTVRLVPFYKGLSNEFPVHRCDFSINAVVLERGSAAARAAMIDLMRGSGFPQHFPVLEYKSEDFFKYFQWCISDFKFNEDFFSSDYRAFFVKFFHHLKAHFDEAIRKYKVLLIRERHRLVTLFADEIEAHRWKNLYIIPEGATRISLLESLRDQLVEYREYIEARVSESGEIGYLRAGFFLDNLNEVLKDPYQHGQLNELFFLAARENWKKSAIIIMPHLLKLLGIECSFENRPQDSLITDRGGRVHHISYCQCSINMRVKPLNASRVFVDAVAGAGVSGSAMTFAPTISDDEIKIQKVFELNLDLKDLAVFFMEYLKMLHPLAKGHFSEDHLDVFKREFFKAFRGFLDERQRLAVASRISSENYAASITPSADVY